MLVTFSKDADELRETLEGSAPVRWIQLHGYPTPGTIRKIKAIAPDVRVIKVLHVRGGECVEAPLLASYEKAGVDVFLFDVVSDDGRVGSTGQAIDPAVVAPLADKLNRGRSSWPAGSRPPTARTTSRSRPILASSGSMSIPTRAKQMGRSPLRMSRRSAGCGNSRPETVTKMPSVFTNALLAGRLPIIMEVKRNDGEGAELMGERTIPEIVGQYVAAGAPCISVVTGRWFGGNDDMLTEVAGLTDLPLLKKDFITREKQIVAAKELGASAILLTAKILPSKTFQHLIELSLGHGLTPFVEVVDQAELDSVIHPEDCIIAVNNKDINTREREPGDIDTSRALLEATIQAGTPCPVSASAILDPRIAAELVDSGFKGLLIGTGLLRADSIQGWVDEFERHRAELEAPVTPRSA